MRRNGSIRIMINKKNTLVWPDQGVGNPGLMKSADVVAEDVDEAAEGAEEHSSFLVFSRICAAAAAAELENTFVFTSFSVLDRAGLSSNVILS